MLWYSQVVLWWVLYSVRHCVYSLAVRIIEETLAEGPVDARVCHVACVDDDVAMFPSVAIRTCTRVVVHGLRTRGIVQTRAARTLINILLQQSAYSILHVHTTQHAEETAAKQLNTGKHH